MTALVPVRVADCSCPDTPHDVHNILLAPTISLDGGIEAERAMVAVATSDASESARARELIYAWAPIFVRHGAVDWDLCNEHGDPIPFDVEVILADYSMARLVSEKANDLGYGDAVLAPFSQKPDKPSPTGPTPATTSRRRTPTPSPSESP